MPDVTGIMRERLVVQSCTEAGDGTGEPIKTWSTLATIWGRVTTLYGRELMAAQAIHSETTTSMTVRYRTTITTKMRVVWRSKNWNIHAIIPDEGAMRMKLLTSEVI